MDFSTFKAPFISLNQIRTEADAFRKRYVPEGSMPTEIHDIIEFDLELEIRPISSLSESADIDALLLGNLTTIVVDSKMYIVFSSFLERLNEESTELIFGTSLPFNPK